MDERLLGAIIAGGRSRRFGSDKARATVEGRTLFDHVVGALSPQVADIVLCGRDWPGFDSLDDRPEPGLGPLGGLCAALHHAAARGYSHIVAAPVDVIPFPGGIVPRLVGPQPRVVAGQYMIGAWPALLALPLEEHLRAGDRSMRSWIETAGAEYVDCEIALSNINYRRDLEIWCRKTDG